MAVEQKRLPASLRLLVLLPSSNHLSIDLSQRIRVRLIDGVDLLDRHSHPDIGQVGSKLGIGR
jgi:hypothetical protein